MLAMSDKIELIKQNIKCYQDFPKPGILFRDVFSVMNNPEAAKALHDLLIAHCTQHIPKVQVICALESRGFLFGTLISVYFHIPFVPIRKKGKLPGSIKSISYTLEYGSETLEIQSDALKPGSNVLLVDDLLATGGSLAAGCKLISSIGGNVDHCLVIMELEELNERSSWQWVSAPILAEQELRKYLAVEKEIPLEKEKVQSGSKLMSQVKHRFGPLIEG